MAHLLRRRVSSRRLNQAARVAAESLEARQLFAAGDLDAGFGSAGRTVVQFPVDTDAGNPDFADRGVELKKVDARNGLIVVAGEHATGSFEAGPNFDNRELALARLTDTGAPDPTFDSDGTLYSDLLEFVTDVHIQSDNKVLVAGSTIRMSLDEGFALVRFNADGSLDTGFGGGDGIVEFDFTAASVVQQPDGKIVVGGNSANAEGGFIFAAARLLNDGSLDADFGDNGIAIVTNETLNTAPPSIAIQPTDGKLMMLGNVTRTTSPSITGDGLVIRLNNSGNLDQSFSGNGKAFVDVSDFDSASAIGLNASDEIFVGLGGLNASKTVLARLSAAGKQAAATQPLEVAGMISDLQVSPAGKVVLFGVAEATAGNLDLRNAVIRYNADGTLDTAFAGGKGYLHTNAADDVTSGSYGDLQDDGKIIAGTSILSPTGPYVVSLSRYLSGEEGTVPPTVPPGVPPTVPPGVPPTVPPGVPPTVPPGVPPTVPPTVPPSSPPPVGATPGTFSGTLVTSLPTNLIGREPVRRGKAIVAVTNASGDLVKGNTGVELFVSADATLDDGDATVLTTEKKMKLKPGQTKNVKLKVKDLPVTDAGGYQLLARITAPDQSQSLVTGDVTFPVAEPVIDLAGAVVKNIDKPVAPGGTTVVAVGVQNLGNVATNSPLDVSVFASTDSTSSDDDILLQLRTTNVKIKPQAGKTIRVPIRLPSTLAPGSYFVVAKVDSSAQIPEPDEVNNLAVATSPFTVG